MKFEARLALKALQKFAGGYVDYSRLKDMIEHESGEQNSFEEFETLMANELDRVRLMYLSHMDKLHDDCGSSEGGNASITPQLALDYVHLLEFSHLNMEGFRKLVKKARRRRGWESGLGARLALSECYRCTKITSLLDRVEESSRACRPRVIIFDKDGTLVTFNEAWAPWVEYRARMISEAAGRDLCDVVYSALGYDPVARRVFGEGSILAWGNRDDQTRSVTAALQAVSVANAEALARAAFVEFDSSAHKGQTGLCHERIPEVLRELQNSGIQIGIVTTDSRASALRDLAETGLKDAIFGSLEEILSCGDDPWPAKPHPAGIIKICAFYGVPASSAWMVGDTRTDLCAGRAAGCAAVVGVKCGTGAAGELRCEHQYSPLASMDVLVQDVTEAGHLALSLPTRPTDLQEGARRQSWVHPSRQTS